MASTLLCAGKAEVSRFQTWPSGGRLWAPPEAPAGSRAGQALVLGSLQMLSQATLVQIFTALQAGEQPASQLHTRQTGTAHRRPTLHDLSECIHKVTSLVAMVPRTRQFSFHLAGGS